MSDQVPIAEKDVPLFGTCRACRRKYRLRSDGTVRGHRDLSDRTQVCIGEYQPPADTPTMNPWRPVLANVTCLDGRQHSFLGGRCRHCGTRVLPPERPLESK